jgi:hypothetical protein
MTTFSHPRSAASRAAHDLAFRVVHRFLVAAALLVVLGLASGCGGDPGGNGSALPDAAGASPSADATTSSDQADLDPEDAMLKFAECMREHGVDMPDPSPGGGIRMNGEGLSQEQMEAAQRDCQKWMDMAEPEEGGHELTEEEKQQFLDMAGCMRERGYNFPDPTFDGGRVTQKIEKEKGGPDLPGPDDPAFQQDMEECSADAGLEPPGNGGGAGPATDEHEG